MSSLLAGIPALDAATLAPWRLRFSRRAMGAAGFVVLALTVAAVLLTLDWDVVETYPAEYVESADNVLGSLVFGLFPGALLVLWIAPRAGVWVAVVPLLLDAAFGDGTSLTMTIELAGALVLIILGLVDAAGRARQESAAQRWAGAPVLVPDAEPPARGHVQRWRAGWTGLAVVLLVVAAVTSVVFVNGYRAAKDFRAGALEATGIVVEVSDDDSAAVVEVDGLHLDVPLPSLVVDAGDKLAVRYDGSGRAEAIDDVADPSEILIVATAALTAAVALLVREARRRRRVTALLRHGGPAVRLLASWDAGDVRLSPVGTPNHAVATVVDLMGLTELRIDDDAQGTEDEGKDEDEDEEWMRPVGEVSDADLLRRAKQLAAMAAEDDQEEAPSPLTGATPDSWVDTEVVAVGLVVADHPVALRGPDGSWYVTETGARMPARWPWEPRPAAAPATGTRDRRALNAEPGTLEALLRRTSGIGPWLAVAVLAAFAWWVSSEVSWWGALLGAVGVGSFQYHWSQTGRTYLSVRPRALVMHQMVLDEHYPWARVLDVVADDEALAVRTTASEVEEADALLFAPCPGEELLPGVTDPHEARVRLLAARAARVAHATADTRTRRRLSPHAAVAAVGVLAWLGGMLLG